MFPTDVYNLKGLACGQPGFHYRSRRTGRLRRIVVPQWNTIVYSAADILSYLAAGKPEYKIAGMYLEFINLASPGDPVSPPTYDRSGAAAYYAGLAGSPDRDFVRVSLLAPAGLSSTDATKYVANKGLYIAQTSGGAGRWGKTFGPSVNSTIYGAALVAMPSPDDPDKDFVYARSYPLKNDLVTPVAIPKLDGEDIVGTWPLIWT